MKVRYVELNISSVRFNKIQRDSVRFNKISKETSASVNLSRSGLELIIEDQRSVESHDRRPLATQLIYCSCIERNIRIKIKHYEDEYDPQG